MSVWFLSNDNYGTEWLGKRVVWSGAPFDSFDCYRHRPMYELIQWCKGQPVDDPASGGFNSDPDLVVLVHGKPQLFEGGFVGILNSNMPIESVVAINGSSRTDEYGFLGCVVLRQRTKVQSSAFPGWKDIPLSDISAALNSAKLPDLPPIIDGVQTRWAFFPLAILADTLLLTVVGLWIYSTSRVPCWPLWHRLTPAQRRRARGCCPNCNYNLEGLTTPTCPECGNPIPNAPHA